MQNPKSFVKGIGKGTGKLIGGVATGVVGTASTIVGTASGGVASIARGVATLTGNDAYVERSENRRREMKASGGGVLAGFKAGGESIVGGVASGITGLVTKPFEEGRKGGALGFIKGVGQGIVGIAAKPIMGVTEGISSVAQGINQQFASTYGAAHVRPKRALWRREARVDELIILPLDIFAAEAQNYVIKRALKRNFKDTFLAACTLGFNEDKRKEEYPFGLCLSLKCLTLMNKVLKPIWSVELTSLSHVVLFKEGVHFGMKFIEYDTGDLPKAVFAADKKSAGEAYDVLVHFRDFFGNPGLMEPFDRISATFEQRNPAGKLGDNLSMSEHSVHSAHSDKEKHGISEKGRASSSSVPQGGTSNERRSAAAAVKKNQASSSSSPPPPRFLGALGRQVSLAIGGEDASAVIGGEEYSFGRANATKFSYERLTDEMIKSKAIALFESSKVGLPVPAEDRQRYHKMLDEMAWKLVFDWSQNHDYIVNPSRCCLCLILNYSTSVVQIFDVDMKEGSDVLICGVGAGYDSAARAVQPLGGAAVVFGQGKRPSLISLEHVKLVIRTNAFSAMLATRQNRAECTSMAGFFASFLEKSRTDWWAKYVIIVNSS